MRIWTSQEEDTLKEKYTELGIDRLCSLFDRNAKSIQMKAHRLGLKRTDYRTNDNFFSTWNDTMAYLLGFFASDGNVFVSEGNGAKFTFAQKAAPTFITWIRDLMCPNHKVCYIEKKDVYSIQFTSNRMYQDLCEIFGMPVECKSKTLAFPDIPSEYFKPFIIGCMDGDGSFGIYSKRKPRVTLTCGSNDFTSKFIDSIYEYTGLIPVTLGLTGANDVLYQGVKAICFAHYFYKDYPFMLHSKYQDALRVMEYRPLRIHKSSITPKMADVFSDVLADIPLMEG